MKRQVLIIGYVWPEPKSSAAGSRMLQLIDTFLSENYTITFATPCAKSENAFDLSSLGVNAVSIALNHSSFDAFIKALQPNIVMYDRFMMEEQFGWRVTENCPDALQILNTEDLHCLRKTRHQALKDKQAFSTKYLFSDSAKREIASIYRCDLSLIISEVEIDILKTQFKVPETLLLYLPFMLDKVTNDKINNLNVFKNRAHFITIGNFLHAPNYDAVLYLKATIWPLIKKQLPKAEMHVYGAYASQKVYQLHNEKSGFFVKGFADNVDAVMCQAKVCLAPIRFGAGLKGKLVDAMKNGTPCITTAIGAEGIYGTLPPNGYVEDDPEKFAKKAVELYKEDTFWKQFSTNGFKIINTRFNKSFHEKRFLTEIEEKNKHLFQYRLSNFTGQMLRHHTMQSTKFMSKWIEEKNKTE